MASGGMLRFHDTEVRLGGCDNEGGMATLESYEDLCGPTLLHLRFYSRSSLNRLVYCVERISSYTVHSKRLEACVAADPCLLIVVGHDSI